METKKCTKCGKTKPKSEFFYDKSKIDGLYSSCKNCAYQTKKDYLENNKNQYARNNKKWRDENKDKINKWARNAKLRRCFNITQKDYDILFNKQNGLCLICEKPETIIDKNNGKLKNMCIDHDHKTGRVRGLLCSRCNKAIGAFNDDYALVYRAYKYLFAFSQFC